MYQLENMNQFFRLLNRRENLLFSVQVLSCTELPGKQRKQQCFAQGTKLGFS